jgi:hypothetical protein
MRETIPLERIPGGSALYRDYALDAGTPIHGLLGDFRSGAADWAVALAGNPRVDARLVERLVESNRALGAGEAILDGLRGLAGGTARVVVSGQQPGVGGGPLMTLHKIATTCALAREVEARHGVRCVPVFWIGADDDDFAEIRELVVAAGDLSLVSASLDASATAPGRRIGDIGADAVRGVWSAVAPYLPQGSNTAGALAAAMAGAADLGDAAARCIVQLCGGEVAVVDGREPLLRECARDLLLAFFDREDEVRSMVAEGGASLEAAGYHAQLDLGDSSGLFLVVDGVRHRIPRDHRAAARERFASGIGAVSPGVIARNLVQDSVFAPVAVVLGPAEIAYRAQLTGVYEMLGIARPVVFPRMNATFIPPAVVELAKTAGIDAATIALDPGALADAARASLRDDAFGAAARQAEAAFAELAGRFLSLAGERLDARATEKLEKRFADLTQRLRQTVDAAVGQDLQGAAARFPFLSHLPDLFARGGVPQERYLSMAAPHSFHGDAAWGAVRDLAGESVAAALDGRVGHRVYSI